MKLSDALSCLYLGDQVEVLLRDYLDMNKHVNLDYDVQGLMYYGIIRRPDQQGPDIIVPTHPTRGVARRSLREVGWDSDQAMFRVYVFQVGDNICFRQDFHCGGDHLVNTLVFGPEVLWAE